MGAHFGGVGGWGVEGVLIASCCMLGVLIVLRAVIVALFVKCGCFGAHTASAAH